MQVAYERMGEKAGGGGGAGSSSGTGDEKDVIILTDANFD
jgi:hypothetical protein